MTTDTKSQKSRKVAVLGPIPRDEIVTDDGERFEKYGCALYTAVALSALLEAGDTIVPVSHVRREDEGPLKQILASFPNIDSSGITSESPRSSLIRSRWSTSWTRPVLATRSPRDWLTATSRTGTTSWPASTGTRWALSAVPDPVRT
jgi:hypothetical protein